MTDIHSPLFILSPRHGQELALLCEEAGWRPIRAENGEAAGSAFTASGASVAVVDARDALTVAEGAVAALGPAVETARSALLLILAEEEAHRLPWFREHGVTHFLLEPWGIRHFIEAVNYAAHHAERVSGGRRRALRGERPSFAPLFTDSRIERRVQERRASARGHGAPSTPGKRLEIDLASALRRDEIEILYQPQIAIASGRMTGAEALARWRHPELGEIGAEALFDAAAGSGLLVVLSSHIQEKALAEVAAWPSSLSGVRVSLNITAEDIVAPDFADIFLSRVAKSGVHSSCVTVEVTESGLIEDLGAAASLLARFREAGLRVAIDDFGTGYSSLAYLKALPLDYLKIDKHLSADIIGSPRDRIVVRGVIDMARSLGLDVVAEGVETEAQLNLLAAEGCTLSQGFLHSPPVTGTALAAMAAAGA